ncbi:MAG: chemotaxis protein CheA [Gammaproteobacteria bacterium]|nr:MAG: chemotaxis protein CheA [Gammaproteobacteria bacterium]
MSFEADEEILQDFLVEAGEILEEMSEQLVALENDPENMDLLNGIFRGFHTVKGGAGFLNLTALVAICHITENIFDILRNGDRVADADLMDYILKSLDLVNEMFDAVRAGDPPEDADPQFLKELGAFAIVGVAEVVEEVAETVVSTESEEPISDDEFDALLNEAGAIPSKSIEITKPKTSSVANSGSDDISDDEFEALLDELHGSASASNDNSNSVSNQKPAEKPLNLSSNDEISDDEFESLLDELHGKGDSPSNEKNNSNVTTPTISAPVSGNTDMIGDDEFESLLDELHGANKGPTKEEKAVATPVVEPKPVKKEVKKAVAKPKPATDKKKKPAKKSNAIVTEATVRVDTKRLDDIMNMVGELVLARNRLKTVSAKMEEEDGDLAKAVANLDIVTADLQGAVMKTRMQPIKKVFGRFPRVVRDLARSLKKEIELKMVGEETDLDKNLVEALADPLVHLVRNSVDHGIEMPEDRVASGKTRSGTITLSATQEGDHIMLTIKDDGKGMDADILRGIAVDKGMMDKETADRLTDNECYNLIFHAGFSTKKEISDISGRGVGMDVVKTKITQLNGSLDIISKLGEGTTILIKVPLTLAILPTLMIKLGEQAFAFPLSAVNEIFHLDLTKTNTVDGQLMIVVREKALPLFFLNEMLVNQFGSDARERQGHVVLAQIGTQTVGFVVDSLVGQEEVVIKPLGKSLQGTPGIAGATITSDGKIALILDIPTLLNHYA